MSTGRLSVRPSVYVCMYVYVYMFVFIFEEKDWHSRNFVEKLT